MTVFIVWFSNFHSIDELVGIYLEKVNAEERINMFSGQDRPQLRIEETTLDD